MIRLATNYEKANPFRFLSMSELTIEVGRLRRAALQKKKEFNERFAQSGAGDAALSERENY